MLTMQHVILILTVGVLVSAGIALVTERVAVRIWGESEEKSRAEKDFRLFFPVVLGTLVGLTFFPLVVSLVVGTELGPMVADWRWLVSSAGVGLVGGLGSKMAYDVARRIFGRV